MKTKTLTFSYWKILKNDPHAMSGPVTLEKVEIDTLADLVEEYAQVVYDLPLSRDLSQKKKNQGYYSLSVVGGTTNAEVTTEKYIRDNIDKLKELSQLKKRGKTLEKELEEEE